MHEGRSVSKHVALFFFSGSEQQAAGMGKLLHWGQEKVHLVRGKGETMGRGWAGTARQSAEQISTKK